jgi:hypothetical protein
MPAHFGHFRTRLGRNTGAEPAAPLSRDILESAADYTAPAQ